MPHYPTPLIRSTVILIGAIVQPETALARGERGSSILATSTSTERDCITSSSESSRAVSVGLLSSRTHTWSANKTPGTISALLVRHPKRVRRGSRNFRPEPRKYTFGACPQKEVSTLDHGRSDQTMAAGHPDTVLSTNDRPASYMASWDGTDLVPQAANKASYVESVILFEFTSSQ